MQRGMHDEQSENRVLALDATPLPAAARLSSEILVDGILT